MRPKILNVCYWQINDPNGENPNPLSREIVLESIALLNITFNPNNIFFKYRGYEEIDSLSNVIQEEYNGSCSTVTSNGSPVIDPNGFGTLSRCQFSEFWEFIRTNNGEREDAINIYIPYETDDFAGVARSIGTNQILVPTINICNSIFIHEMGHALGLRHTHTSYNSSTGCERVTRNPNDASYNATTAGDRVADTAAVPDFINEYCFFDDPTATCNSTTGLSRFYIDENNCTYIGANTDCDGVFYRINSEDVRNYMSYSDRDCFDYFSPGQGIRMQETIESDSDLRAATTDVASLYEPYAGEYYDGTGLYDAIRHTPLFQPGFIYEFYSCRGDYPQPADYDDISFDVNTTPGYRIAATESNYFTITHRGGYSFRIVHPSLGEDSRRCYTTTSLKPTGGTIIQFQDNVFNNNVVITPQDSIQINNENLIQNLQPGLYKIDKEFPDGTIEEQVISKNNE